MSFSLTVLGSSSAIPTANRFPTAQVLKVHERFFLIDCGEGTQMQLRRFSINMARINHIFISHLHGDHVFGLFGLFSTYNLLGRKSDLHVYAYRDLEISLEHFKKYFGINLSYAIIFHPFTADQPYEIYSDRRMTVHTLPLRHSVPVVGFIFRERQKLLNIRKEKISQYALGIKEIRSIKEGNDLVRPDGTFVPNSELTLPPVKPRSFAFCTDTSCFNSLAESLKGIDLLYFETTFIHADKKLAKLTNHSTSAQAATLAKNAGVGKLLMGHFSNRYKNVNLLVEEAQKIFPQSFAAEDGDIHSIPEVHTDTIRL